MWSFISQYHRVISRTLSHTYVIRGHFQVPVPCERSEGIGLFVFFSSPLKDNFMLMKNAAKESDIQESKIDSGRSCALMSPLNRNGAL